MEKSQIVGVYYVKEKKRSDRWEYRFVTDNFRSRQSFCTSVHGEEGARLMAEKSIISLYERFDIPIPRRENV